MSAFPNSKLVALCVVLLVKGFLSSPIKILSNEIDISGAIKDVNDATTEIGIIPTYETEDIAVTTSEPEDTPDTTTTNYSGLEIIVYAQPMGSQAGMGIDNSKDIEIYEPQTFAEFLQRYNKLYYTQVELQKRFKIFSINQQIIEDYNKNNDLAHKKKINYFSDFTKEEVELYINDLTNVTEDDLLLEVFTEFMTIFQKVYNSNEEKERRFEIFKANTKRIEELQKTKDANLTIAHPFFFDLTEEEIKPYIEDMQRLPVAVSGPQQQVTAGGMTLEPLEASQTTVIATTLEEQ